MSYDNPIVVSYNMGIHDFGAGGDALAIKPPPLLDNGRIFDIHVAVTETFNQVTTPGYIRLGITTDADYYAELNMGAAADTDAYNVRDVGESVAINRQIDLNNDTGTPSQVEVAFVAPTGGTPAGQGYVTIAIGWW